MRYALLIFGVENEWVDVDMDAMSAGHAKFAAELGELGKIHGGVRLQLSSNATVVQVRNGEALTIDGPFMETKEQLGGFYLIEADDLDEAIAWAAKIPATATTSIEVRPLVDYPSGR